MPCAVWYNGVWFTAQLVWNSERFIIEIYIVHLFMLLHLLQTSDRRQISGQRRACGKGCGVKRSHFCFMALLSCWLRACQIYSVAFFLKRGIKGEGCEGSSCELWCRPWPWLVADMRVCTFSTFTLGGHQCLDLHSLIINSSIHLFASIKYTSVS